MLTFARQLPARDVLDFLPKIRSQTRASFRSRAARALRLFWRLFRFSASVDHQMTPALFRPLFRASPSRGLHWRTGCRDPLRGPSDLKHHAVPGCGEGKLRVGPDCALYLWSFGRRALPAPLVSRITRLAVKVAGKGRALGRGRLAPFELRTVATCRLFPHASHRVRLRGGDGGLRAELRLAPLERWAKGIPAPLVSRITRLAVKVAGWVELRAEAA